MVGAERRSTRSRSPAPRAATSGTTTASATSTSPRSSSTSHRPPASEDHRGDQGAGRPALHDRPADGERVALAARAHARRGDARGPVRVVLHERRRRGERERDQARALVTGRNKIIARYRSYHGATNGAVTLTGDPRRWARRSPGMPGRRADVRPLHVPLPRRSPGSVPRLHRRAAPRGDPRVRGRTHGRRGDPRDGRRHERDHPPARRLPAGRSARSATGTGSC